MEQNLRATKKAVEYSRNLCNRNLEYFSTTAAQKQVFEGKFLDFCLNYLLQFI